MKILVTGGAGFIGSAVIRHLIRRTPHEVVNLDALTYAATPEALEEAADDARYAFVHADIADVDAVRAIFAEHRPDAVMHLAAESHVDRSIDSPDDFIRTNIVGTFTLLRVALDHHASLTGDARAAFRFHHISTDEVYGSLGDDDPAFTEETPYRPNSPYSASKASSDHLVRAWGETYGLPFVLTNCSNNYGPWQFPEKLIPVVVGRALDGEDIPVYGQGQNVRDWLHVEDHAGALVTVLERGEPGRTYNIGGRAERRNLDVVHALCALVDELRPREDGRSRVEQIRFVTDRPGHDHRYAIDQTRIARELGWTPEHSFETGLRETVAWYLEHEHWWRGIVARGDAGMRIGLRGVDSGSSTSASGASGSGTSGSGTSVSGTSDSVGEAG